MQTYDSEWEVIAKHGEFVRRLARSLVRDASRADDLVQQAWLAFLDKPPRALGGLRGWLAGVVRNTARHERRSDERRRRRERHVGHQRLSESEAEPKRPDELREHELMLGAVTDAVRALDERYRSVILLRFYENLKPREVAARLDIPVETVRTRTRRALEQIAKRLDAESGGNRRAWALALIPFCGGPVSTASAAAGMGTGVAAGLVSGPFAKLWIGLAASAVIALVVWAAWPDRKPAPNTDVTTVEAPQAADPPEVTASRPAFAPASGTNETPETGAGAASEPTIAPKSSPVAFHVQGVVIDAITISPIEDARVRLVEAHGSRGLPEVVTATRTDSEGRFRFNAHSARRRGIGLEVEREGYVPAAGSRPNRPKLDSSQLVIRMFPGVRITGEVVYDSDGSPVEGGHGHMVSGLHASANAHSPQGLLAARFMSRDLIRNIKPPLMAVRIKKVLPPSPEFDLTAEDAEDAQRAFSAGEFLCVPLRPPR